jgi:hypothetical protein
VNIIDLLWFALFVGGGAILGARLAGGWGLGVGAVAGVVMLFLTAWILRIRVDRKA